jgi:adenylate kinase family enzyme
MKVIAVLGLSGVGKTMLVNRVSEQKELLHLTASDLIKARLAQTSEQLRKGAVADNH